MGDIPQRAAGWIELIKGLPDPYAWAKSFRDSARAYKDDVARAALVDGCRKLVEALRRLELNPSTFLYCISGERLDKLSDERLEDPEILDQIGTHIRHYEDDFERVLAALGPIEEKAYVKIGEPVLQLRKGLAARHSLLRELESAVAARARPQEIRAIGAEFDRLIEEIQPIRQEIRRFATENDG